MKNSILLEGLQDTHSDFEFARRQWDKLGLGVNFDDAYNAYYKKNYDPEHWDDWRDPVYSEEAWNELVQSASGENESLRRKQEKRFEDDLEEAWDNPTDYANYFLDNGSDINEIKATLNKDGHNSEDFLSSVLDLMDELAYNNYEDDYETYGNSYSDEYEYADPDPEVYDTGHAEEWTDKHPYGYYNNEDDYGLDDDMDWEGYDESFTYSPKREILKSKNGIELKSADDDYEIWVNGKIDSSFYDSYKDALKEYSKLVKRSLTEGADGYLDDEDFENIRDEIYFDLDVNVEIDFDESDEYIDEAIRITPDESDPDLLDEIGEWCHDHIESVLNYEYTWTSISYNSDSVTVEVKKKVDESLNEGAMTNGSYSLYNGWVKVPDKDSIPDEYPELEPELSQLKDKADKCETIDEIDNFIDDLYKIRQNGLLTDGEYGKGNLLFKEIRNAGILDRLKKMKVEKQNQEMSLESLDETKENYQGYIVWQTGGSLGDKYYLEDKIFDTREEAKDAIKNWKDSYRGNKSYYKPEGRVYKYKGKTPKEMRADYEMEKAKKADKSLEEDYPDASNYFVVGNHYKDGKGRNADFEYKGTQSRGWGDVYVFEPLNQNAKELCIEMSDGDEEGYDGKYAYLGLDAIDDIFFGAYDESLKEDYEYLFDRVLKLYDKDKTFRNKVDKWFKKNHPDIVDAESYIAKLDSHELLWMLTELGYNKIKNKFGISDESLNESGLDAIRKKYGKGTQSNVSNNNPAPVKKSKEKFATGLEGIRKIYGSVDESDELNERNTAMEDNYNELVAYVTNGRHEYDPEDYDDYEDLAVELCDEVFDEDYWEADADITEPCYRVACDILDGEFDESLHESGMDIIRKKYGRKHESLTEDSMGVRELVADYLLNLLSEKVLDNLAVVVGSKIPAYDPDWCSEVEHDDAYYEFVDSLVDDLFANAPIGESKEVKLNEAEIDDQRAGELAEYLDVPVEDINEVGDAYSPYLYEVNGEEYYVLTSDEAEEAAKQDVLSLADDMGLESFSNNYQETIVNNFVDEDFIMDMLQDEIDYYRDEEGDEETAEYLEDMDFTEAFNYIKDLYDEKSFKDLIKDHIDWNAVAEDVVSIDGPENSLARYDGKEIELGNYFAYRCN